MKNHKRIIKNIILLVILLAASAVVYFVLVPLFDAGMDTEEQGIQIYGFEETEGALTLENEDLLLEFNPLTTSFVITYKQTGAKWHSVPPEGEDDSIALPAEKEKLLSNLMLTYSTQTGVSTIFNTVAHSVTNGVYEVEKGEDYIRVNYSMGNISRMFLIPEAITETRMDEFLSKMEKSEQKQITEYYRKYNIEKLRSTDNKDQLLADYPDLENELVYVMRDSVADYLKERMETCFEKAGYTQEEYDYDLSRTNAEKSVTTAVFNISVIYKIEGSDLIVEIPFSEIDYISQYPITKINLLPSFGAGGSEDMGYMLVPDGTGGIINFNNGKLAQNPYYANVYGWDWAMIRKQIVSETQAAFPVFGMVNNGNAFVCIIENGSAFAGVSADIGGRYTTYNTISATYNILHGDSYDVSDKGNESVYIYEASVPEGSIKQRYCFMATDSYVDMANKYREYLRGIDGAASTTQETALKEDVPLVIEIVGAIDKIQHTMGIPVSKPLSLTTYTQAKDILVQLSEIKTDNLHVKYSGWMNDGMNQKILNTISLVSDLGTQAEFNKMLNYAKESEIPLYLDGLSQYARNSGIVEGFLPYRDAAQHTTREEVELYSYSLIWYGPLKSRDTYYLLKPAIIEKMTANLGANAKDYGAAGISLRDTGYLLSADYNPRDVVTREKSMEMQVASLAALKEVGLNIMIRQGNVYALPYADVITNLSFTGGSYSIIDEYVPFYTIAIQGMAEYTGNSINLADDYEQELLRSAEMGAGLYFVFMQEDGKFIHETDYTHYYGANMASSYDAAIEIYSDYQMAMKPTQGQRITGHERYDDVTVTIYENGASVYVNYSNMDKTVKGVKIPARSYLVKEVGK